MTGLNHGMTGAVIALTIKQPAVAVPIAFLSHFAQDVVPHWNYGVSRSSKSSAKFFTKRFNISLLIDFCLSVFLMVALAVLFPAHKWLIWGCMVAAAAPDLAWAYYRLYKEHIQKRTPEFDVLTKAHAKLQWSQTAEGFFVEVLWFIACGIIISNLR